MASILAATALAASLTITAGASATSPAPVAPTLSAYGSAEQVYAVGLAPSSSASLVDSTGRILSTQSADSLGGLLFRDVPPGSGYRVRALPQGSESESVTVYTTASTPWDPAIYNQSISPDGYGYLTTRDGTKLAIDVHPPQDVTKELPGLSRLPLPYLGGGPYPTLIEYSGYGYADPAGPQNGIAVLANLMGFTVVDVNMRGTGCSGGAYDFFEPLQNLDGYDVIETIAHQPWVLDHKVGMMGISYGGMSQLFTAQTDPPDLEAISPLSTIDSTESTLYPGGILNTGFAVAWAGERVHDAEPASPSGGQAWAYQRIQQGDGTCRQNQVLHGEAVNLMAKISANNHYVPSVADPLAPISFVNKITVPVFMACQWEDEQTGGHCPDLAEHFTGSQQKWFTFTNGAHIDSIDPDTLNRWYDFLELYVAHQPPIANATLIHVAAPLVYQQAMGMNGVTLPLDPIQAILDYPDALAAFRKLPEVRVLFDNGAGGSPLGDSTPGNPYPGFEQSFSSFPVPGTVARQWYLGPLGTLTSEPPADGTIDSYSSNANVLPATDYPGNSGEGGLWSNASAWEWAWKQSPPGSAVSYVSAPLTTDTTVIGAGSVDLWVRSSTPDVDLQATISEVQPDGRETFVQNGWVRASGRALDSTKSTLLEPVLSLRASDVQPMPPDGFVEVVIPLYYEGHAYRVGSRIRVTIAAPNGTQPVWSFGQTVPAGTATVSIAFSTAMPSSLILPVVPGVNIPTGLPACPSLRNEPCRPYVAIVNRTSGTSTAAPGATTTGTGAGGSLPSAPGAGDPQDSSSASSMGPPSSEGPSGFLAVTGAELVAMIIGALILLGLGTVLAISMRRRSGQQLR